MMIPVPFSSLFFGKYSGWNWRIQSLWTAFQFKGKFILSESCITAMLFSKTFIGLARSIKIRYSFQWQYLGADLQPLCVEMIIAVWDACFVSFHPSFTHQKNSSCGTRTQQLHRTDLDHPTAPFTPVQTHSPVAVDTRPVCPFARQRLMML